MTGKIRNLTTTGVTEARKIRNSTIREELVFRKQMYQSDEVVTNRGEGGTIRCVPACPRLLRVLIVDDYKDCANTLAILVRLWGHVARVAYDGAAVLDMIAAYQPDVLLMDIAMPGLDGFQLAQQLRRDTRFQDTLLIAMTGYADKEHRLHWEGAFDHYLIKPAEPSTLESLLMLEQHRLENMPEAPPTSALISPCSEKRHGNH